MFKSLIACVLGLASLASAAPATRPTTKPATAPTTQSVHLRETILAIQAKRAVGLRVYGEVGVVSIEPNGSMYQVLVHPVYFDELIPGVDDNGKHAEMSFALECSEDTALSLRVGRRFNLVGTITSVESKIVGPALRYTVHLRNVKAN